MKLQGAIKGVNALNNQENGFKEVKELCNFNLLSFNGKEIIIRIIYPNYLSGRMLEREIEKVEVMFSRFYNVVNMEEITLGKIDLFEEILATDIKFKLKG